MPRSALELLTEKQRLFLFPETINPEEQSPSDQTETLDENKQHTHDQDAQNDQDESETQLVIRTALNEHVERRKELVPFTTEVFPPTSEDVVLVFPNQLAQINTVEEDDSSEDQEEVERKKKNLEDLVCGSCGEKGHLSFQCTNRGARRPPPPPITAEETNTYLTPAQRAQLAGETYQRAFTVRLSNIPDTMTQDALRKIFTMIGGDASEIIRVNFPRDHITQKQRDTCFIDFPTPDAMARAIELFDGYLFESMVFRCEKAQPRK